MEDFRRQFLFDSAANLEAISETLRLDERQFSDSFKRETFRTLHTIKGTAQTFGFATASRLAHQLETMLAANDFPLEPFREGISLLQKSLTDENFQIPEKFIEKTDLENWRPDSAAENLNEKIPDRFLSALSNQEKSILQTALRNGQNLFCLEIGFALDDFADCLIRFRETLGEAGEIVATLPSQKFSGAGKIGFQILYATSNKIDAVKQIAGKSGAEIIFDSTENFSSNDLHSVAELIVRHAKQIADETGKSIKFKIVADETKISGGELKIVFDILLHLVRNAVDHAVRERGKIAVNLRAENETLHLKVSDDGDGINLSAIRAKAIEKNLISEDATLSEQDLIDLIFAPEFSTKSAATEISGRGIGLNAVSTLVEKSGGTIQVETASGKGTAFEITLPIRQNNLNVN